MSVLAHLWKWHSLSDVVPDFISNLIHALLIPLCNLCCALLHMLIFLCCALLHMLIFDGCVLECLAQVLNVKFPGPTLDCTINCNPHRDVKANWCNQDMELIV